MISSLPKLAVSFFQGIILGIAEIIPGVSGSTLALLMGIYDDFIDLLYQGTELVKIIAFLPFGKSKPKDVQKVWNGIRWNFAIPLGVGMVSAIIALSSVMTYLLLNFTSQLYAVLFGLSLPTLWIVWSQIKKRTGANYVIMASTAITLLVLFVALSSTGQSVTNPHPLYLFLGGMIAVSTMVLPGVSGSFMLLVLGLYTYVIGLISAMTTGQIALVDVGNLLFLMAGMGAGFLTTVRLLRHAFAHWRDQLMSVLFGLLIASWYVLWPFVQIIGIHDDEPILAKVAPWSFPVQNMLVLIALTTLVAGTVGWLQNWADRRDAPEDEGFDKL